MQGLEKRGRKVVPCEPRFNMNDKVVRDAFKKLNKRLIRKLHPENYIKVQTHEKIINQWRREEDYDSWTNIFVIEATSIDEAKNILDSIHYCWEGETFNSPYDCTGRPFSDEANFYQLENRVFVVHHWQLDV